MLTTIFCQVDDFCKFFLKDIKDNQKIEKNKNLKRCSRLTQSEFLTICFYFSHSGYKTFKDYYIKYVLVHMKSEFPNLVSYTRFLELKNQMLLFSIMFFNNKCKKSCTGTSYIDSFPLRVCHNRRIHAHKTLKTIAKRGHTSVGWFYGLKLHLVTDQYGEIINSVITPRNIADNNKNTITELMKNMFGKVYGDKGYMLNKSFSKELYSKGIHIFTGKRKNMKTEKPVDSLDALLLGKRGLIESVGSILKESLSLEHSRHRSIFGFFSHVFSTLIAYQFREKKPSIA